jgi:enoyl-[acyl-carrier protein] reductase/trans-2-enoyl-CoA reductase (NAD+)
MIVAPKIRGFICTTAHPVGCAANVNEQVAYVKKQPKVAGPKKVLIIGASTGYGLASRIAATFASDASTIGVFFEKPADEKRTASAGWYNTAAFETAAHAAGHYAKSINGDAFSDAIKQQTIDLIKQDWQGGVDLVIYSLASPRRVDPKTGEIFSSTLKPIGETYINKTVDVMNGIVSDINISPASPEDIQQTVKVMGGEDFKLWIDALLKADLLANGVKAIAYSYIGPEITYPIYRAGTIGHAKEDLEKTTLELNQHLQQINGQAYISVNKALVTQASSAIPVVPLYISLLYKIMKRDGNHEGCIEQMYRLFHDRLYSAKSIVLDDEQRIRIDDWELSPNIQAEITQLWPTMTTENLESATDIAGYRADFKRLFGFGIDSVDYEKDVDVDVKITSID